MMFVSCIGSLVLDISSYTVTNLTLLDLFSPFGMIFCQWDAMGHQSYIPKRIVEHSCVSIVMGVPQ